MQTATNPETGERVFLDGNEWKPLKTATNPETGKQVYQKGDAWVPLNTVPEEKAEELREMGKVDPRGMVSAIASGGNRGVLNLVDLPFDILNMTLDAVGAPEGIRTATPTQAVDFLTENLGLGRPIEKATTPTAAVDTPTERITGRVAEFATESATGAGALSRFTKVNPSRAREGIAGAGAGLGLGATEEVSDNPAVQLAGSVIGAIIPSAATAGTVQTGKLVRSIYDQFTEGGAERRVGRLLVESTDDPAQAIQNLKANPLLMEDALGVKPDSRIAVDDPGVQATLNAAVRDNTSLVARLDEGFESGLEGVRQRLTQESAQGSPSTFISRAAETIVERSRAAKSALNSEILYVESLIGKLEGEFGTGDLPSNVSTSFQTALSNSYERARKVGSQLWEQVDYKETFDAAPLQQTVAKTKARLKAEGVAVSSFPDGLFDIANTLNKKNGPQGFKGLSGYLSSVLDAKRVAESAGDMGVVRALGNLENDLKGVLYDAGGDARTAAAQFTRRMHDSYDSQKIGKYLRTTAQGAERVDPETVLNKVVRPGENVGDIRRVIELERNPSVGALPEGVAGPREGVSLTGKIEEYVKNKFIGLDQKARQRFIAQHRDLLANMPTLGRDLSAISTQIDELAQRIAQNNDAIKTIDDTNVAKLSALMNSDPTNIYSNLSRLKTDDIMAIKRIAEADGALSGMQSVYIREMSNRLLRGENPSSMTNLLATNDKLRFAFENVLSNEQRANLRRIEKANEALKRVSKGEARDLGNVFEGTLFTQILARIGGVQLASAGGGGAGSLQRAAIFSSAARNLVDRMPAKNANRIIQKAVLDPEYMAKLMSKQFVPKDEKQALDKLRLWFLEAGVAIDEEE